MPALEDHIKRITEKFQLLLRRYDHLQKENRRLKDELAAVGSALAEKKEYIAVLEQRVEALKMSKGTMSEEEKKLAEKRIRHFLKEIDKCIAFLNE